MPNFLNTTVELARHPTKMAILPIGATEQHSRHLPLATDTLIVEAVSKGAADKLGAYGLPTLPFSISHMHRGKRGTVWIRNQTLVSIINDIAMSLRHEKFSELVLLNGHGGNFILLPIVQDLNLAFPDLLTMTLDCWEGIPKSGIFKNLPLMNHADEFETSCVMFLCPDAVRKTKIRDLKAEPNRELLRYLPFSKLAAETHTGKPSQASPKKGKQAIECMIHYTVTKIRATLREVKRYKK